MSTVVAERPSEALGGRMGVFSPQCRAKRGHDRPIHRRSECWQPINERGL